jgi:hypothetical protein
VYKAIIAVLINIAYAVPTVDMFRFMESFQTQQMGDHIVVPANVLDR